MHRRRFISTAFPSTPGDILRVVIGLLSLFAITTTQAQISGSATVVSDYRFRGVSLSQGNPEAQVNIGYDNPNGMYAGGFASGVDLNGVDAEQFIAYGGYTSRLPSGLSWEAGVTSAVYSGISHLNYSEAFAGLTSDNYSARIYYSPRYLDQNTSTLYAELNAAYTLEEDWRLLAHVGLLHPLSDSNIGSSELVSRYDGRLAINARIADWNAQLAWVVLQEKSTLYPQYQDRNPRAVILSVSYSF
jgi:uncharacterized protein (TIGR02001 family)